jgi:hypothetical protein
MVINDYFATAFYTLPLHCFFAKPFAPAPTLLLCRLYPLTLHCFFAKPFTPCPLKGVQFRMELTNPLPPKGGSFVDILWISLCISVNLCVTLCKFFFFFACFGFKPLCPLCLMDFGFFFLHLLKC